MASKPKRSNPAPESKNTRYVLLSSSPMKPHQEDPTSDAAKEPESPVKQVSSISTPSGFRAASTFHTTSISQVQAQRKTLGTRRTMQGWSVKHSSMPKPRPS
jgi:DNA helicase-2/ATP-dependent DNA helicase PcrA